MSFLDEIAAIHRRDRERIQAWRQRARARRIRRNAAIRRNGLELGLFGSIAAVAGGIAGFDLRAGAIAAGAQGLACCWLYVRASRGTR